jgi:uncharacterized protein YbjQ (UPF0145 family)
MVRESEMEPVAQVSGSCVYHVGWQYVGSGWSTAAQELGMLTQAYTEARLRAARRMRTEAELAGADAVVGVRVRAGRYDWAADLIEYSMIGTAVRAERMRAPEGAALTNLSGQDCALLARHGHRPRGLVGGSSVYYGQLSSWTLPAADPGLGLAVGQNFEYQGATRSWYAARHSVLESVRREAAELAADGVVGTDWRQEERPHPSSENVSGVIYTIHALATAIATGGGGARRAVSTTISL